MMKRTRRLAAIGLVGLGIVGLAAPTANSATSASDWGPGFRACGSFKAEYTIHVFAKDVGCAKARKIQKEYWLAPPSRQVEVYRRHGPQLALLKRFPGWRCFSGSGGGTCAKGSKVAAYSDI